MKTKNKKTRKPAKPTDKVNEPLPVIWNVKMTDNPDGSALMTFDHEERFVEWFKQENPGKKTTKKNMGDFLIGVLTKAVQEIDGYAIQKAAK